MTTAPKHCGGWTVMGHGDNAVCGETYFGGLYQCAYCALADANAEIARLTGAPIHQLRKEAMKPKLSQSSFAVGVLLRAASDAAAAPAREEAETRIKAWIEAAKARYKERCGDSIPDADAQACAQSCYMLNCMTGTVGAYQAKPHDQWPDPLTAADEDMDSWGHHEGSTP